LARLALLITVSPNVALSSMALVKAVCVYRFEPCFEPGIVAPYVIELVNITKAQVSMLLF
jgi:hypothetical protein